MPLLHIKNKNLPRGVRKVETELDKEDLNALIKTIPGYDRKSLLISLHEGIILYSSLRNSLFDSSIRLQSTAEERVIEYYNQTIQSDKSKFHLR